MTTATPPAKRRPKKEPKYFTGVGEQVVKFAETQIIQTKGRWAGKPLFLEDWQKELLNELYLVDAKGKRVYQEALVGVARKNGKSSLAAAIALHGLVATGESSPEVYAAAASQDQARIVFQQAREYVEASPTLRQWLKPQRSVIHCAANNGVFRVLSADAPLQHGLNPSLVVIDELHAHRDPELYFALTTGTLARLEPLIVSITTAGFDRETICWRVFEQGSGLAAGGKQAMRKAGFLHFWKAPATDAKLTDRKTWTAANPSSWVTNDVLEREFQRLPESVFRRLHLNQWVESEDFWISPEEFDACAGKPVIKKDNPTWMGVDIGLRRDATAIIWVQWHGDKLHIRHDVRVPKREKPLSSSENRTRVGRIASRLEGLREVAFDPWAFGESAEMLADQGLPMVRFDQTNQNMAPASQHLYELIREGRLVHDGDLVFRNQVLSAVAAESDRGWRISKRLSRERVDACVALAMAVERAIENEKPDKIDPDDYRISSL